MNLRNARDEQAVLPTIQSNAQLDTSNTFLTLFERELAPTTTFTQTFLQSILASVDSKDPVVANAWLETLMDMIDLLPPDIVKQEILPLAVAKGQHSQPIVSRLASCKILGKVCSIFDVFVIKKEILPVVQSLCQDVDYEVRSCVALQLDAVARGLGLETAKGEILPWLVELSNDESSHVRLSCVETVVNLLSLLDDETCIQTIIPLVKKFCDTSLQMEDAALPIAARQLGRLCHGLSVNLDLEEKQWFLKFYRQLARLGLPGNEQSFAKKMPDIVPTIECPDKYVECRQSCAYNFPAVVLFGDPKNFKNELYDTFCDLVCDPHSRVRQTMACCMHEVAKLLGPSAYLIQPQLVCLLEDGCIEVVESLIPNLPVTLEALAREGSMNSGTKLQSADNIVTALINCERAIASTTNWRLHAEYLAKLSCLPACFTTDVVYRTFVPLFFHTLYTVRPIPCRLATATTLLYLLRSMPLTEQRHEMCSRLIDEFCNGYSCHKRMLFISICGIVMELFSKAFFKDYFLIPLLQLSDDRVANVRLKLCSMFPCLKALIKLPDDQNLLHSLEATVRKMMANERDRDVSAALRNAIMELDKIEIFDMSNRLSDGFDDEDDLAKEQEERLLWHLVGISSSDLYELQLNIAKSPERDNRNSPRRQQPGLKTPSPIRSRVSLSDQVGQSNSSAGYSVVGTRSDFKKEIKSAIPLPKRSYTTSSHSRSKSPDSPMPSPETLRRAAVPSPGSRSPKATHHSLSIASKPRASVDQSGYYLSSSSPSTPKARSPEPPPRRYWRPLSANCNNSSPTRGYQSPPRCSTPPLFESNEKQLSLMDNLVITQLSPPDETTPHVTSWGGGGSDRGSVHEFRGSSQTHQQYGSEFTMNDVIDVGAIDINGIDIGAIDIGAQDHHHLSSYSSRSSSSSYSPASSNAGSVPSSPQNNRRPQTGIPRLNQYQRANTPTQPKNVDRKQGYTKNTQGTGSNIQNIQHARKPNEGRSRLETSQKRQNSNTSAANAKNSSPSLTRAKSTSHLSPGFGRKPSLSLIPRVASSGSRSPPVGRSPSAPSTPRCMSPVRLQPHYVNRQRVASPQRLGLHLPLTQQGRLAGCKFLSRPGSPASVSGESDGQGTPDSPCSYGSNDSSSDMGSPANQSRLRRFSGGSGVGGGSKIPSLVSRSRSSQRKMPGSSR